jgi:hypothetical protein
VDKLIFTNFGYGGIDLGFGGCPQAGFVDVLREIVFGTGLGSEPTASEEKEHECQA